MFPFAERWCDSSRRVRLAIGLLMILLLAAVVWVATRSEVRAIAPVSLSAQWQKVMPLREPSGELSPAPSAPFSAFDFDGAESRLLSWQPAGKSGALMLETAWSAIPPLFTRLAERRQGIREFSIQPDDQRLTLTLQLEAIDDE